MGDGCHKYALTLPYWPNMTQHDAIFNTGVADSTSSKQITGWIIHFTTLLGLFPSIIPIGSRREVAWIYPEIWEVPKMGYPQSSSILIGFSLLNHLGYPHDYGNQGKYDHCHPGLLAGGHCTAGADHSHSWSCECASCVCKLLMKISHSHVCFVQILSLLEQLNVVNTQWKRFWSESG